MRPNSLNVSSTFKRNLKRLQSHLFAYYSKQGLDYLREYLHLPAEIVPATHKRPARPVRASGPPGGREGGYRAPRGDREDGYRKKDQAPSGEFRPRFGGVGRGAPRTE